MADYDIIIKAQDKTGKTLGNVNKRLNQIEKSTGGVTKALGLAGTALAALGAGRMLTSVVNQYRAFEKYSTVLTTYLGSAKKANSEMARLTDLSKKLPQNLNDLTEAFVLFQSRGLDTSTKGLTAFANIAAANSKTMTQLGEAVADALTGEFERLKEFGIKVSKENDQFVADIGNGQSIIAKSSADLVRKLQALGEEGGKFGDAANIHMKTLDQSFSNLDGAVYATQIAIGEGLKPELKAAVDLMTAWIEKNKEMAKDLGVGLGEAVRGAAAGIKILADNIDLIRNAAIALIAVRFAGSFTNLVTRMSSATKASQSLGGMLRTMGKVLVNLTVGPLLKFARMLGMGGPVGIAIMAVLGLFELFKGDMFTIGKTSTNMGRLVNGSWQLIKEGFNDMVTYLGGAWNSFASFFSDVWNDQDSTAMKVFTSITGAFKKFINFQINNWIALGQTVVAIFKNFPRWFAQSMKAMLQIATDFGNAIVEKFTNIGTAIKQAMSGDFTDAWDTLGKESAFSFADSWKNAFAGNKDLLDGVNYDEIYSVDRIGQASEFAITQAEKLVRTLNLAAVGGPAKLGHPGALGPVAETAADPTANKAAEAAEAASKAAKEATKQNIAYADALYKKQFAMKNALRQTEAGELKTAADYADALLKKQWALKKSINRSEIKAAKKLANAKIDETHRWLSYSNAVQKQVQATANSNANKIKAAWEDMSQGMAQSMAEGVMSGKSVFSTFGDYLKNWANKMLTDVIEKHLMKPMVDQMGKWMGEIFSGPEATGGANNLAGTMNSLIGGLGNSLTGLFNNMSSGMGGLFSGLGNTLSGLMGSIGGMFGGGGGGGLFDMIGGLFGGGGGLGSLFGGFFADGGYLPAGKVGIAGEAGAELISGPARITSHEDSVGSGGGAPVVININAIDTQSGTQFLLDNKREIEGIIHNAYNKRGKQGIYN